MFTGLIEEVGSIREIQTTAEGARLTVTAGRVLEDAGLGASIAIDGACTTVVEMTPEQFVIEASPETLDKTVMGDYKPGTAVNLERPLLPNSRLGGHFVTGHVDGRAVCLSRETQGNSQVFHFRVLGPALAPLLVPKGSVAINGISLTVNTVKDQVFSVAIIPHTLEMTTMDAVGPETVVNIETDLLGKYVQRLLQCGEEDKLPYSPTPAPVEKLGNSQLHTGAWFNLDKPDLEKPGNK